MDRIVFVEAQLDMKRVTSRAVSVVRDYFSNGDVIVEQWRMANGEEAKNHRQGATFIYYHQSISK